MFDHVTTRASDRGASERFSETVLDAVGIPGTHSSEHVAFAASSRDHGGPGERPAYGQGYYAAYVLDPDGNNVEVVCRDGG